MDRSVAWRAALLRGRCSPSSRSCSPRRSALVLPRTGAGSPGPGAWAACALAAGALLRLPPGWVLPGAALSGLPSLATVLAGVHWAGTPLALILFGAWCGWIARRGGRGRGGPSRWR